MNKYLKIFFLFLFIITIPILSQNKYDALKRQAVLLMTAGRFSEAVDQLNKYIAANFNTQFVYEDNVSTTVTNPDGSSYRIGPKIQFKEILGIGFSYKF